MLIEKNYYGAWVISALVHGYLKTRTYYGISRRDAIAMFKEEFHLTSL